MLVVAAVVWLPTLASVLPRLARGVAGNLDLAPRARGDWLLGFVATEGLAVLAGILVTGHHSPLHYAATVLWVFGGLLYLAILWLLALGWGLATAWIPVLALGEVWRIAALGWPRFSPERWTMVFPLGMYSVCGMVTGEAFGVAWIEHIGHWWFVIALAAWVAVAAGEVRFSFQRSGLPADGLR